jgi:hypothetical protein
MKKFIALAILLAAGVAQAEGTYASLSYDYKDKQESTQLNHVIGLTIGQKLGNGFSVEGRMENEKVDPGAGATQKQEGLVQLKGIYDISTGTMFTPYAALAIGNKNKSTVDFPFYVGEVGVKAKLNDTFTVRYGYRQRTAFDNNTTNSYDTRENTLALTANITKVDAVGIRYAQERGTSDYNTTGVFYTRNF